MQPEAGVNALYELAYQVLQTRNFSEPEIGLKMNWTLANAGTTRNMIPPNARAIADVRVLRVADYDAIEKKVRETIKNQLLPESKIEMNFERRRPPLEASASSFALAKRAQQIYRELGKELVVDETPEGGGTDAAFAALNTKSPVIERLGLRAYGPHSADAEYILIDSIAPRLYLLTRMIMDVSRGKTQ
jgi:glutamate carboxypeptidase